MQQRHGIYRGSGSTVFILTTRGIRAQLDTFGNISVWPMPLKLNDPVTVHKQLAKGPAYRVHIHFAWLSLE